MALAGSGLRRASPTEDAAIRELSVKSRADPGIVAQSCQIEASAFRTKRMKPCRRVSAEARAPTALCPTLSTAQGVPFVTKSAAIELNRCTARGKVPANTKKFMPARAKAASKPESPTSADAPTAESAEAVLQRVVDTLRKRKKLEERKVEVASKRRELEELTADIGAWRPCPTFPAACC